MTGPGLGRRAWWGPAAGGVVLVGAVVLWFVEQRGGGDGHAEPLTRFLVAVATILVVCHAFGALLRRWGHPAVLGEIIGGLLLGPSALGILAPQAKQWLFPPEITASLDKAAQLGLIVFMFLLGSELRFDSIGRKRTVVAVVAGGMGLPFVAGAALAMLIGPALVGSTSAGSHVVFLGLALSITALPVLARILIDIGQDRGRIGTLALTSAAVGDGVAWLGLATILTMVTVSEPEQAITRLALAVALVLVTMLCVRPALAVLARRVRSEQLLPAGMVIGAVAYSVIAQQIDLHPVIGAFLFGAAAPRGNPAVARASHQLQGFAMTILLPLYFAGVGLGTSVGLLGADPVQWLLFLAVLATATLSKFVGVGGGAMLAGLPRADATRLGVLMNCRGITELVVASIGLKYGLINELGFTMLVLVAVITTALTGLLMRRTLTGPTARTPAFI